MIEKIVRDWLSIVDPNPDPELYRNLIKEELNELLQAHRNNNKIELVDGLIDHLWVCTGYCIAKGIDMEDFHERSHITKPKHEKYDIASLLVSDSGILQDYPTKEIMNLIIFLTRRWLIMLDVDYKKAIKTVADSNYSKILDKPIDSEYSVEKRNNKYVLIDANGKIRKPPSFKKPDWSWIK